MKPHKYVFINGRVAEELSSSTLERISSRTKVIVYGSKATSTETSVGSLLFDDRRPLRSFERILEIVRAKPWNVTVVDYSSFRLRAARHLLMKTVLWKRWEDIFVPDYFVKNEKELVEILLTLL